MTQFVVAPDPTSAFTVSSLGQLENHEAAVRELKIIASRAIVAPANLRSTPAWELLLQLFVQDYGLNSMPTRELIRSVGLSEPVGMRWISVLAEERLVRINPSPFGDAVSLAAGTRANIAQYFAQAAKVGASRRLGVNIMLQFNSLKLRDMLKHVAGFASAYVTIFQPIIHGF